MNMEPNVILQKQLDNIAAEKILHDYKVDIVPISSGGANYLSINFKAKIVSTENELNLFAKVAEFSEAMRSQMSIDSFYEKEITIYTRLLSTYKQLQEKYGIPEEDRYTFPEYYAGSFKRDEECVVMEDLFHRGYTLYDRLKAVSDDYAFKGVEELAKFHALSLSFKHEHPNEYAAIFRKDEELFNSLYEPLKEAYVAMAQNALALVPDHLNEPVQQFLKKQLSEETYKKYYTTSTHGIIIHGDYRASNILFKSRKEKVTSLIPVDFQTCRIGLPSFDLLYFIYCGTDEKFRKLHLKQLIDHYYDTFARFLRLLNMDPDREFSREEFDDEYRNTLGHGLMTALTVLTVVMIDPEKAPVTAGPDGGDLRTAFAVFNKSEEFKERFLPILNEFVDYGVI